MFSFSASRAELLAELGVVRSGLRSLVFLRTTGELTAIEAERYTILSHRETTLRSRIRAA